MGWLKLRRNSLPGIGTGQIDVGQCLTVSGADARIAIVALLQEDARGAGFQALKATQLWRKGEKVCSQF